ncbi:IS66 family insertion sequence element accessory protein TnpA [Heyndrickxia sporothermodurans]|uniref:IS66 family insertion sequence element accessory protein TnpA n=1 Tax=Heyndrickxia sporothermodurans TaxID=46224 RepID=UPI0013FE32B0
MSQRNNPELRKEWERRIALFRASGLTQSKWCEINEISIHKLKYWLYKADIFYST